MTKKNAQKWDTELTQSQVGIWVRWWPLLELTQASHWKQPRTLTVASFPQFTHWYMPSVHVGPAFPVVWFHKKGKVAEVGGNNQLWETKGTWIQDCIWAEWRKYLLAPAQEVHQGQFGSVYCQHKLRACLGPPLLQHFPTMGQRSWCGRGKSTLLKGKEPAWAQPSGVLLQQPEIKIHSQLGGDSHEQRGNPTSYPAQFQDLHLLLRWWLLVHPEERSDMYPCQIQFSHQRNQAHAIHTGTFPQSDTHVRPQKVTVLSKFIEVEKVKQDEKAEELVSIKRARENPEEVMKQR